MVLSLALGVVVLALVLLRQTRIRPVPRQFVARLPVVLGVIGLFDAVDYAGDHHPTGADDLWVIGTLAVGAVLLGAARALTVRIWSANQWVVRQGTPVTMALWLVSLAVHFFVDGGGGHKGASGLEQSSFLLYLALTLGVQAYVIHRRAAPLWDQLGPDAGRGLRVTFGAGPGGVQTFFANFGGGGPGFNNQTQSPGFGRGPEVIDADVIEAEVVDDDDPPGLPRAH
jgi:hypothetical protein